MEFTKYGKKIFFKLNGGFSKVWGFKNTMFQQTQKKAIDDGRKWNREGWVNKNTVNFAS